MIRTTWMIMLVKRRLVVIATKRQNQVNRLRHETTMMMMMLRTISRRMRKRTVKRLCILKLGRSRLAIIKFKMGDQYVERLLRAQFREKLNQCFELERSFSGLEVKDGEDMNSAGYDSNNLDDYASETTSGSDSDEEAEPGQPSAARDDDDDDDVTDDFEEDEEEDSEEAMHIKAGPK
mmetsp:Transcript_30727/g.49276  ORF Transcript_30727/g.49276 Transcript_30727/m.49276 type:complete len:178 (+) Transcript_30727:63-596(+)